MERLLGRLLNGKERKFQNSKVSKEGSHNFITTFPHIVLQNVQLFSHITGEVGQAMF